MNKLRRSAAAVAAAVLMLGAVMVSSPAQAARDTGWDFRISTNLSDTGWDF